VIGLWSVIPTLFGAKPGFSELIWFMSMYVTGAYFRNHGSVERFQKRKKWVIATWAFSVVFLVASVVVLDVLSLSNPEYLMKATSYSDLNQLPTVLIALTLFVMFTYAKPRSIPWINRMATHMFGIYLVHDHPLLRAVLWGQLFSVTMIQTSPLMPVYAILSILIVFWSSFVIDVLKHLFLDRGIGSLIDWLIKEVVMKIPYLKPRSSGSSLMTSK
jgi:surface polysaccharide O-acyltransferase-like enzyme